MQEYIELCCTLSKLGTVNHGVIKGYENSFFSDFLAKRPGTWDLYFSNLAKDPGYWILRTRVSDPALRKRHDS